MCRQGPARDLHAQKNEFNRKGRVLGDDPGLVGDMAAVVQLAVGTAVGESGDKGNPPWVSFLVETPVRETGRAQPQRWSAWSMYDAECSQRVVAQAGNSRVPGCLVQSG